MALDASNGRSASRLLPLGAALVLAACGDHGGSGSASTYGVGGSISGLSTAGLVLQNNAGNNLAIAANTASFQFPVAAGSNYNITVATQPAGLACTVGNGAGANVQAAIANVTIACQPLSFTVGGTIAGLTGNGLVLQNNGGNNLAVPANATAFEFTTRVAYGGGYTVTVSAQPTGRSCSIANASGAVTAPVGGVTVTCGAVQFVRFDGRRMILSNERVARDAATGSFLDFVFVDNTSSVNPDGGRQRPYPTLALAEANSAPNNIIYVFPGDGTTTGMDSGFTLQAKQKLWGAGMSHDIQTSEGTVAIPAAASSAPKLTSAGAYVVTLSTDNDISGLTLQDAVGGAIFGADPGSVRISSNSLIDNTSISSAPIILSASALPLTAVVDRNTISGNTTGAVYFLLNGVESNLSVTKNTIASNGIGALGPFGSAIVIDPAGSSAGSCTLLLSDNTISNNAGNALYGFNGGFDEFHVTASGNTMIGDGGGGLVLANAANVFTLAATDNVISDGGAHGIATGGGLTMATAHITLSDNRITGNTNAANGISLHHDGTDLSLTATNNEIAGNEGSGILLYSSNPIANVTASIQNNTISNNQNMGSNASGGIDLEQFTSLQANLTGNTLSGNVGDGVFVSSTDPAPYVCMQMSGNNSDTGYFLSNGTGIFNLAPAHVDTVNTGTITTIGTITNVLSCPDAVPVPP